MCFICSRRPVEVEVLNKLGYRTEPSEHAGEHGWEFPAYPPDERIWFQVTSIDIGEVLLTTERMVWNWKPFSKPTRAYDEFIKQLDAALTAGDRFHKVVWYAAEKRGRRRIEIGRTASGELDTSSLPA